MSKKPTGLNKKVSSIFSGIPNMDNPAEPPAGPRSIPSETPAANGTKGAGILRPSFDYRAYAKDLFRFKRRPRLAFDIGLSRIKAVLMTHETGRTAGPHTAEHEFPLDDKGMRTHEDADIVTALTALADTLDPEREAQASLVLTSNHAFTALTEIPAEPRKEWKNALAWQLADAALFSLEDSEIEWRPTHIGDPAKESTPRLLVAAAERSELDRLATLFHEAGLTLEIITPAAVAIEGLMKSRSEPLPAGTLVMDIGAEVTECYFFHHGHYLFMRRFSFGGDAVHRSLSGTIQVDQERIQIGLLEAATLLKQYQLLSNVQQMDPEQPKRSQLAARLRPLMEKLVAEIQRSIAYCQAEFSVERIDRIFITGGGSELTGLAPFLTGALNIPVDALSNTEYFSTKTPSPLSRAIPSLPSSFALALGLGSLDRTTLNFSRWEDRWAHASSQANRILIIATAAVFLIGSLYYGALALTSAGLSRERTYVEQSLNAEGPRTQQLEELTRLETEVKMRQEKLVRGFGREPLWGGIFRELSRVIPREMVLDRIEVPEGPSGKELIMYGYLATPTASGDVVVSELLKTLNESPFFTAASLLSRAQEELEDNTRAVFSIKAQLR